VARGWKSIHPLMEEGLKNCGIKEEDITQGWGFASASNGFHAPEGWIDGHKFSSCVDLTWRVASVQLKSRLVEAGFCPFFRDWPGNMHIHCVFVGAKDARGKVTILPGPRMQIIDFINGKNGLASHKPITGVYAPTADEREQIKEQYAKWAPHYATRVLTGDGRQIKCYAFYDNSNVRCEIKSFLLAYGYPMYMEGNKVYVILRNGKKESLDHCRPRLEGGQFVRGDIRPLAETIGKSVTFQWKDSYAEVIIS